MTTTESEDEEGSVITSRESSSLEQSTNSFISMPLDPPEVSYPEKLPESYCKLPLLDVKLFFKAIEEDNERIVDKLLDEHPVFVLVSYFGESPLIAALRRGHEQLALFLLENGADTDCIQLVMTSGITGRGRRTIDWYEVTPRSLAYDRGLHRMVEALDYVNGEYCRYLRPPPLSISMRFPRNPIEDDFFYPADNFFSDDFHQPRSLSDVEEIPVPIKAKKKSKIVSKKAKKSVDGVCSVKSDTHVVVTVKKTAKSKNVRPSTTTGAKISMFEPSPRSIPSARIDTQTSLLRKRPFLRYNNDGTGEFRIAYCSLGGDNLPSSRSKSNFIHNN